MFRHRKTVNKWSIYISTGLILFVMIISGCVSPVSVSHRRRIRPKENRYFYEKFNIYKDNLDSTRYDTRPYFTDPISSAFRDKVDTLLRSSLIDIKAWEDRIAFHDALTSYKNNDYQNAILGFNSARERFPILEDYSIFFIAQCYEKMGDIQMASDILTSFIERFPNSPLLPEVNLKLADILFHAEDYADAVKLYAGCLKDFSKETDYIRYQIALCNFNDDNKKLAFDEFKDIFIDYPETDWSKKAEEHIATLITNNDGKMIQDDVSGNHISPSLLKLLSYKERLKRADNLYHMKQYQSALLSYKSLMDEKTAIQTDCEIMFNIAKCYRGLGENDQAIKVLEAIIMDLQDEECASATRFYLARRLWNQDKDNEAKVHFEYISGHPVSDALRVEALYLLGRMSEENGAFSEAIDYFQSIIDMGNNNKYFELSVWRTGWIYYLTGYYEYASAHFDLYMPEIKDDVSRQQFLYWKGRSEEEMGYWDTAVRTYHEILNQDYWSYYSGLVLGRLGYKNDYFHPFFYSLEKEMEIYDPVISLDATDALILNRINELFMTGLIKEASNEICHYAYSKKPASPQFIYSLASLAHANREYELGIRLGILYKRIMNNKQENAASNCRGDLLLYPSGYFDEISERSIQFQLDPILVLSIIRQESLFDTHSLSYASAYGLMQVIPPTGRSSAKGLGIPFPSDLTDLYDIDLNLKLGCYYLNKMLKRFDNNLIYALAAYNGGPNAVEKWQGRYGEIGMDEFIERISYPETREYVKRIMKNYLIYKRLFNIKKWVKRNCKSKTIG